MSKERMQFSLLNVTEKMEIGIIVAMRRTDRLIGLNNPQTGQGIIPWMGKVPSDMRNFQSTTMGDFTHPANDHEGKNAVIMGRITWECIPEKYRPLKNRVNIVVTKQGKAYNVPEGVFVAKDLKKAITIANRPIFRPNTIFIGGGVQLYTEALKRANFLVVTYLNFPEEFEFDFDSEESEPKYFPEFENVGIWKQTEQRFDQNNGINLEFARFER